MPFIVESSIPTEVTRGDFHRRRDLISVRADEIFPRRGIAIAETLGIFTPQGDDVRPNISAVVFQLGHRLFHVHVVFITEQAVRTEAFGARTSGDVLHVAV